jgi:peptide/nickel transport system permease protein
MATFILKRVAQAGVVLLGVTMLTFALTRLLPGGVAHAVLGPRASRLEIAAFNHANGLDRGLVGQYLTYLDHLIHLNLGFSYKLNQSVASLLKENLPKTLLLVGGAYVVAIVVAIPMGLVQAARRNGLLDHGLTLVSFVLYAMPVFWLAILLIVVFADKLNWLPAEAPQGGFGTAISQPLGMILPVMTLALVTIALFARYMRSAAIDSLVQDYVNTARAKGASERRILSRHVFRNATIPLITIMGYNLPIILSGALLVEVIFNFPGMGLLMWNSATSRDYPVLLGCVLVVGVATVLGNLAADVCYAVADPRVRLS